ncbi:MAG: histidine triad nucleotide-binding protein, partial [Deltaproteobacteria bacterium]
TVAGLCDSPITGADGNKEFLIMLNIPGGTLQEDKMENCLFCKIIKGEIPSKKVFEDERILVIEDITPQAPIHLLLIPKRHFANCLDMKEQDDSVVGYIFRKAADIAREKGVADNGFRMVQNNGENASQSVFHIHFHLLAGRGFTWPPG